MVVERQLPFGSDLSRLRSWLYRIFRWNYRDKLRRLVAWRQVESVCPCRCQGYPAEAKSSATCLQAESQDSHSVAAFELTHSDIAQSGPQCDSQLSRLRGRSSATVSAPAPARERGLNRWLERVLTRCTVGELSRDDCETLLRVRRDFGALSHEVARLLSRRATASDIYSLYQLREEVNDFVAQGSVGVAALWCYTQTFASAEPDSPHLAEEITDVIECCRRAVLEAETPNSALFAVVRLARQFHLADPRAALEYIWGSRERRRNMNGAERLRTATSP